MGFGERGFVEMRLGEKVFGEMGEPVGWTREKG